MSLRDELDLEDGDVIVDPDAQGMMCTMCHSTVFTLWSDGTVECANCCAIFNNVRVETIGELEKITPKAH